MADSSANFIDLTQVFALKTKISEAPHTWWRRNVTAMLDPDYDYDAKYDTKPGASEVLMPVDNIRRVDEYLGDYFGAKSKVWLKQGSPLLVKEDTASIRKKLPPSPS